ncbi:MAG TPA: hydroxysqualene dehydroxylase HpnE [Elusimicrobiota bacterium]|nr:hydroxysqualene dehydroxylase HpnE [Elusimicrobiota bacterium]
MESTFDALILGGGFAGLSCAAALAEAGAKVLVAEKKSHLGGRAFSFRDPGTEDVLDNGQHLFLGCYRETRRFLARVGAAGNLTLFPKVRVAFASAPGRKDVLSCPGFLPAPWHLKAGILKFSGLSFSDKAGLSKLDAYMRRHLADATAPAELDRLTVRQWLTSLGQSPQAQARLWDPIALGALNDDPAVAGAPGFFQVLREAFYREAAAARPALSSVGLSDLYAVPGARFIESRGGGIKTLAKISGLVEKDGRVCGARTESGETLLARAVVSTLPPWDLAGLALPADLADGWRRFTASPIVGINLWLDRPVMGDEPFVGMIGTDIEWAFNKSLILKDGAKPRGHYVSLVISGARKHLKRPPAELEAMAARDLAACFPEFGKAKILRARVVKEPLATLSPAPGTEALRPEPGLARPGLFLAGDWTRTGLPATIESAVVSGHRAAEEIMKGDSR